MHPSGSPHDPLASSVLATESVGGVTTTGPRRHANRGTSVQPLDRDASRLTEFGFRAGHSAPKQRGFFDRLIDTFKDERAEETTPAATKSKTNLQVDSTRSPTSAAEGSVGQQSSPRSPMVPFDPATAGRVPSLALTPHTVPHTLGRQYWMSDANCSMCFDCNLSFHFWRRRHHCRLCGRIFCNSCSSQTVDGGRYQLTQTGQVRVCKQCFRLDQGYSDVQTHALPAIGQSAAASITNGAASDTTSVLTGHVGVISPSASSRDTPPLSSPFAGLSLLSDESNNGAAPTGLAASAYMDVHRPAGVDSHGEGGLHTTSFDDEEMQIPTGTTPSTKYKRRMRRTASGGTLDLLSKLADRSPPMRGAIPPVTESAQDDGTLHSPTDDPDGTTDVAQADSDDDDDEEEDPDEETLDEFDEDDYVSANPPPPAAADTNTSAPSNSDATQVTASDATVPSTATSPTKVDSQQASVSFAPSVDEASRAAAALHSHQLAEQLAEIASMQLHRQRLLRANRAHLLFVVANLVKAFGVGEAWITVVIELAERCASRVHTEPNRRMKQAMAQQQASLDDASLGALAPAPLVLARDDHISVAPYVKIKTLSGGTLSECRLVDGVIFRKNVAHKQMRTSIASPRVLLLHCALEYHRIENRLSSLDAVREQERAYIGIQVNKILSWQPAVVVVEKTVSRLAQDMIRAAGVTLVINVKPSLMARLARATHAQPIAQPVDHVDKAASMGTCGRFSVEQFVTLATDEPTTSTTVRPAALSVSGNAPTSIGSSSKVIVMSFAECPSSSHLTVLLRGASEIGLKRVKYILRQAINVAYHLMLETALLFDTCATYDEQKIDQLQSAYHARVAQMWGPASDIAVTLASTAMKLKSTNAATKEIDTVAVTEPTADAGVVTSAEPVRVRTGFGLPLSSSPFVDMSLVPIPQSVVDMRQQLCMVTETGVSPPSVSSPSPDALVAASVTLPSPATPLWIHDCILFGSTWFSPAFQCFPPECKGIQFYTDTDKTLGQFLLENCFDLKLCCLNEKCGRDVLKHTLAYTHQEGRIAITVKRIRKRQNANSSLFSPNGPRVNGHARTLSSIVNEAQGITGALGPVSETGSVPASPLRPANSSSSGVIPSSPSPSSFSRHPLDHLSDIMVWSRCKLCARRVTPYMPMSDPTYKISFGKFLDLTFRGQTAAVCRTGGCTHAMHHHHVRYFAYAGLMASFEYEAFPSFQLMTVPKLSVARETQAALIASHHQADLARLAALAYVVFEEFIVRIAEVDAVLDKQEHRDQLRRITKKVCIERDKFTTYMHQVGVGVGANNNNTAITASGQKKTALPRQASATIQEDETETTSPESSDPPVGGATAPGELLTVPPPTSPSFARSASLPVTLPSSTPALAFDSMSTYRLERRLLLNFLFWNKKLGDLAPIFFPKEPLQTSSSNSSSGSVKSWWNTPAGERDRLAKEDELRRASSASSATVVASPTGTPPNERAAADGAITDTDSATLSAFASPTGLEEAPVVLVHSLSGDAQHFDSTPDALTPTPVPAPIQSASGEATPDVRVATLAAPLPQTRASAVSSATPVMTPPLLSPSPSFVTQPARVISPSIVVNSSAAVAAAAKAEKKAEFSFRDFFSRVTDAKPTSSGPALTLSAASLALRHPELSAEAFDPLHHPPHMGVPPSVPPLCVPVHEDQPSSIIAYTLASLEHLQAIGRVRPNEVKTIQAVQSWFAHEEERALHTVEPDRRTAVIDAQADDQLKVPEPVTETTYVAASLPVFNSLAATDDGDAFAIPALAPPTAGTPPPPATNAPLSNGSSVGLSHSHSEQQVSNLYPNSLDATLPAHAPPPLPPHLSCASLLGFDAVRDRPDQVESNMTKFAPNLADLTASTSSASGGGAATASAEKAATSDYAAHTFKYQFDDTGMAGLLHRDVGGGPTGAGTSNSDASHLIDVDRTTFRCTAYFPRQFHALRLMACGGDYDFIQSLCRCGRWSATGGKSGSTFLKTSDERFVLKFITRTELRMFLETAPRYFAYMAKNLFHNLPSFLIKILGVFQLSWKKHHGSSSKKGGGSGGIAANSADAASLSSQYVVVMPNLFFTHTGTIDKIFDLKGSARNRYVKRKNRGENTVLLDENLMEYTEGYPLPLSDRSKTLLRMSVFNDTLFLSSLEVVDYSIIVGLEKSTQTLVVGIIDYIRQYTWAASLEHGVKSVGRIAGQAVPTVISPPQYKQRFRDAMDRYFMVSPDPSSRLTILTSGSNASANANPNEADARRADK